MFKRVCTSCNIEKDISEFSKKYINKKTGQQYYQSKCKDCVNIFMEEYRKNNKEKIRESDRKRYKNNKEVFLKNKKKSYNKNKDKILKYKSDYRKKPEVIERNKKYRIDNKKHINELQKNYRNRNPHIIVWRSILYRTLNYLDTTKQKHTIEELGYSALELKLHIEKLFIDGMSWDNYGEWEIDHIKPVSKFSKEALPSEVNNLNNLQPLWKIDNRNKFNKY